MPLCALRLAPPAPSLPLKARLAPLAFQLQARKRFASTSASPAASTTTPDSEEQNGPTQPNRKRPLTKHQREYLNSALRVNQAGELAAVLIYAAQTPPIVRSHPHLRNLMQHMAAQEHNHFDTFNALIAKHRVRPTAMYPVWRVLATGLGWATGIMGREAAMACTEAVETEIGGHYNAQVKELLEWEASEGLAPELKELLGEVRRIRDEELEHLDHAVEHDAKEANPYELLTGVIRAGCRGAIWVSEKV